MGLLGGHPHSTYSQRRSGAIKPNAYNCVQGGWGGGAARVQGCVRTQKKFFLHLKVSKRFFFGTKEAITLPFIIVYRKL